MPTFIVYEFDVTGRHDGGKRIEGTVENLSAYIASINSSKKVTVTDTGDNLILNTIGNFIDRCVDKNLLSQLLPVLTPYQMGVTEIPKVKYL